jgi:coniferyl-aldehyde dehydrogenase
MTGISSGSRGLIRDAQTKGAEIVPLMPDGRLPDGGRRILPLTVILNATDNMAVMGEKSSGQCFLSLPTTERDEAIAIINSRDRPLALCRFEHDPGAREAQRQNHIWRCHDQRPMLHFAQDALPFGGIGPSGIGQYHGEYGYRALSKEKPIFDQCGCLEQPPASPYGPFTPPCQFSETASRDHHAEQFRAIHKVCCQTAGRRRAGVRNQRGGSSMSE